jgi:type I restriction-modification system DNA methylase subunit/restriction endonuclease S subunit
MLTQEIKRKIDSLRDILVGKVPDPKAQVEQITNALVYKFMDDMDKESMSLPKGKAQFFTNGYGRYSWSKLMDQKIGGQDRLNLYSEAITKMSENPHLPQLFRDIFKDAFLPYRSPETLNLFLKEINDFNYDNSENLGDAFEYLLSILGSQGDAGQFRTPRHIIEFIVKVVDPKKNEAILDPACGTAGFLVSSYKHILENNREKPLTPDEKKKLMENLVGYDISPDMVKLSRVNMYLHGFSNPNIFEYDTLSSEEKWDEMYEVIMANPPFMTPRGGIKPHKRFSVQANRSEVLFVDYIKEHLRPNGRAGIIVPEGVIFQSSGAYQKLRKLLIEDGLFSVVSLPAGVFNPYAGVKTSILFFDNSIAEKAKDILFLKIENDGFDLGAQRRQIDSNDLPRALDIITRYRQSFDNKNISLKGKDIHDGFAQLIEKSEIAKNDDYNLSGERYKKNPLTALQQILDETQRQIELYSVALEPMRKMTEEYAKAMKALSRPTEDIKKMIDSPAFKNYTEDVQKAIESIQKAFNENNFKQIIEKVKFIKDQQKKKWPLITLGEVCDIFNGATPKRTEKSYWINGKIPWFTIDDIRKQGRIINYTQQHITEEGFKKSSVKLLPKKSVLLCCTASIGEYAYNEIELTTNQQFNGLVVNKKYQEKLDSKFLFYIAFTFKEELKRLSGKTSFDFVPISTLKAIKIPLPPITIQKEIIKKIDNYENIISGARQIIDNYKPEIKNDISWRLIELGNLFIETKLGLIRDKSNQSKNYPYAYIKMDNITADGYLNLKEVIKVEATKEELDKYTLNDGDFIYNTRNAPNLVGKSAVYHGENGKYLFNNNILRIRFKKEVNPDFVNFYLNTDEGKSKIKSLVSGTTSVAAIYQKNFATISIPLPSIEIQNEIVNSIKQELSCVYSAQKTVILFEDKISEIINNLF